MSAKTSHRRINGTTKRGGRVEHVDLDLLAWTVIGDSGVEHVVHTLGAPPQGFAKVVLRGIKEV